MALRNYLNVQTNRPETALVPTPGNMTGFTREITTNYRNPEGDMRSSINNTLERVMHDMLASFSPDQKQAINAGIDMATKTNVCEMIAGHPINPLDIVFSVSEILRQECRFFPLYTRITGINSISTQLNEEMKSDFQRLMVRLQTGLVDDPDSEDSPARTENLFQILKSKRRRAELGNDMSSALPLFYRFHDARAADEATKILGIASSVEPDGAVNTTYAGYLRNNANIWRQSKTCRNVGIVQIRPCRFNLTPNEVLHMRDMEPLLWVPWTSYDLRQPQCFRYTREDLGLFWGLIQKYKDDPELGTYTVPTLLMLEDTPMPTGIQGYRMDIMDPEPSSAYHEIVTVVIHHQGQHRVFQKRALRHGVFRMIGKTIMTYQTGEMTNVTQLRSMIMSDASGTEMQTSRCRVDLLVRDH